MANSAKFNREDVIEKATKLYWKNGFYATSMRDLQQELDMRPGSIYSAFENKDGLFKASLKQYTDTGLLMLKECREQNDSPVEALKGFVTQQIVGTLKNAPSPICMLAKTLGELNEEQQELITATKQHMNEILAGFVTIIEEAIDMGEIEPNKDPSQLANHLQIQITGLRTYAKLSPSESELHTKIDEIFVHYPFQ